MKKISCRLAVVLLLLSSTTSLFSQEDSSYLDFGRIKIKKNFVQSVTIKGTDLERMPFSNLSEALKPLLEGAYTTSGNLLYIVDGNMVQDVNAWSIYDIEEIVLVQNAMALINGATKQKQLVLIKTRTHLPGKQGFRVAAQSFMVNTDLSTQPTMKTLKSDRNFYHQLYLSAYKNLTHVQFGISANYLRDVMPGGYADTASIKKPFQLNRFRLYGWLNAELGKKNLLSIQLGYIPQTSGQERNYSIPSYVTDAANKYDGRLRSFNPSLRLQTSITKEFSNDLNAAFISADDYNDYFHSERSATISTLFERQQTYKYNIRNMVISDHITWHKKAGNWNIEPSLNFQYRHISYDFNYYTEDHRDNVLTGWGYSNFHSKGNIFLLTPLVNIDFRNNIALQAGLIANVSKDKDWLYNSKRAYPFASVMIDVLNLISHNDDKSLKIFGSYSKGEEYGESPFLVTDFSKMSVGLNQAPSTYYYGRPPGNEFMGAGSTFSMLSDKIEIGYHFNHRTYHDMVLQSIPGGSFAVDYTYNTWTHRLGITGKMITNKNFTWSGGINITTIKTKGKNEFGSIEYTIGEDAYTGGVINNLKYKKWIAGFSFLYFLNETRTISSVNKEKVNSFLLQNIYIGYATTFGDQKNAEFYIDMKNLAENDKSLMSDRRRFYGVGCKVQL